MAYRIETGIPPRQKMDRAKRRQRIAPKRGRMEDPRHLDLIRQLPCLVSGIMPAEPAHIRFASATFAKPITGIGQKPDDKWTVPLCPWLHTICSSAQHREGEEIWWEERGFSPLMVASNLYSASVALREAKTTAEEIVRHLTAIVHAARRHVR